MSPTAAICAHRQAEPVVLTTGEHVACVCVECYFPLPEVWIKRQREQAEREAYCEHEDEISLRALGDRYDTLMCSRCSRRRIE